MEIIKQWQDGLLKRPTFRFPKVVVASGERVAHLGPRCDFARVRLRFEPADEFSVSLKGVVISAEEAISDPESSEFAQAAILGALDELVMFSKHPTLNVHVILEQMEIHSIDSNAHAFRLAGRDAAYKALIDSGLSPWNKYVQWSIAATSEADRR
ncbi:hypothetical protein AGMMS49545_23480 [Betaproteobacteria bacterium]|nr:hypothetical protein AGMMS49545_23480 [Betaproteobacteria bacterium]GHU43050.1 hypothetical protein AGMMS50289_08790 [Betaproteobacteria bacterium]